jgi:hypothetical protein
LNLPGFALILLLCSKFYFLWGFSSWPQPAAPMPLVLIRDVICWGTLGVLFWQSRKQNLRERMGFFLLLFAVGFLVSLFHLAESKSLSEWAQHYFRNTLLPMLFYPVGCAFFKSEKRLPIIRILMITMILNIFVCMLQLRFFQSAMWGQVRPTGLIGDPLILSLFILFGIFACWRASWWIFLSIMVAGGIVLIFSSSVSAIVSFGFGLVVSTGLIIKSQKVGFSKFTPPAGVVIGGLIILLGFCFLLPTRVASQKDMLIPKAKALWSSAFCGKGQNCEHHYSYEGRIQSNRLAIELCKQSWKSCVLGGYQQPSIKKVDSTFASLILNWGLIFASIFTAWIFWHIRLTWMLTKLQERNNFETGIWILIFFSSLAFGLFNTLVYKYPLNILFYLSMAFIHSCFHKAQIKFES